MNHQSEGVYFCTTGDRFLLVILRTQRNKSTMGIDVKAQFQWYEKGILETKIESTFLDKFAKELGIR